MTDPIFPFEVYPSSWTKQCNKVLARPFPKGTVPFGSSNIPFASVLNPTMYFLGPPQNQHIPCITWCTIMRKCACTLGEITHKNSQISADTWAYSWSYSHEVCNCYAKVCKNLWWPPLIKRNVSPHWLPAKLKIRTTLGSGSLQSWEWARLSVVVLCKPKNMRTPLGSGSLWSYVHVLRRTADGRKDK